MSNKKPKISDEVRKSLFAVERLSRRGIRGKPVWFSYTQQELIAILEEIYQNVWPLTDDFEEQLSERKDQSLARLKSAIANLPVVQSGAEVVELATEFCELDTDQDRLFDEQEENSKDADPEF